jgi:GTPase SAR1 family protein
MQWDIAPEVRNRMSIDNQECEATYMDYSSTTVRAADASFSADIFMCGLGSAAGIVLLYDITSLSSFQHITNKAYTYARMCNKYMGSKEDGKNSCEYILVGNKADLVKEEPRKREVDRDMAEEWAQSQGIKHREVCSHEAEGPHDAARQLITAIKRTKERESREVHAQRRQKRQDGTGESTMRNKIGGFIDKMKST